MFKKSNRILISAFLVLFCLILLPSCSTRNMDTLSIDYKNDKSTNFGYTAAVYGDRIYYVTNELGKSGIYSMKLDGTDVRMEVENPNVTMLEITGGKLYFSGLEKIRKPSGDLPTNVNTLYCSALGSAKYGKTRDREMNANIGAFFVAQDGFQFIDSGGLSLDQDTVDSKYKKITMIPLDYKGESVYAGVCKIGGTQIIAFFDPDDPDTYLFNISIGGDPFVLDTNTGELVLQVDNGQDMLKAFQIDDKYIYCSYNEMVVVLDKTTYSVKKKIIPEGLSSDYDIAHMTKYGNAVYIMADRWLDTSIAAQPLLNEKLYKMDTKTFKCTKLLDLGQNQRILGIDANYIILLDHGEIDKLVLKNGGIDQKQKLANAPRDINLNTYTIDYAGDWMFLHRTYSPGQELVYKINLQSGKVIQNSVKYDFSVLDSYREKDSGVTN